MVILPKWYLDIKQEIENLLTSDPKLKNTKIIYYNPFRFNPDEEIIGIQIGNKLGKSKIEDREFFLLNNLFHVYSNGYIETDLNRHDKLALSAKTEEAINKWNSKIADKYLEKEDYSDATLTELNNFANGYSSSDNEHLRNAIKSSVMSAINPLSKLKSIEFNRDTIKISEKKLLGKVWHIKEPRLKVIYEDISGKEHKAYLYHHVYFNVGEDEFFVHELEKHYNTKKNREFKTIKHNIWLVKPDMRKLKENK